MGLIYWIRWQSFWYQHDEVHSGVRWHLLTVSGCDVSLSSWLQYRRVGVYVVRCLLAAFVAASCGCLCFAVEAMPLQCMQAPPPVKHASLQRDFGFRFPGGSQAT